MGDIFSEKRAPTRAARSAKTDAGRTGVRRTRSRPTDLHKRATQRGLAKLRNGRNGGEKNEIVNLASSRTERTFALSPRDCYLSVIIISLLATPGGAGRGFWRIGAGEYVTPRGEEKKLIKTRLNSCRVD